VQNAASFAWSTKLVDHSFFIESSPELTPLLLFHSPQPQTAMPSDNDSCQPSSSDDGSSDISESGTQLELKRKMISLKTTVGSNNDSDNSS
jgi:hypothetical protein